MDLDNKSLSNLRSTRFSSMFSSRSFIVLGFVSRGRDSSSLFLHMEIQLFQHHLLKSHHWLCCLCAPVKNQLSNGEGEGEAGTK